LELFTNFRPVDIAFFGPLDPDMQGKIRLVTISIHGQEFKFIDSPIKHGFGFTPATSFFVSCETEEEINALFNRLSSDVQVLVPLEAYPFSKRFGWINDRFGMSWKLNLGDQS